MWYGHEMYEDDTTTSRQIHHRPSWIVEDVLVKVDRFLFPIDFMVMDIEANDDTPLILGRPFMKTQEWW